jgi:diaminohydroxyphosphoribosylaminopyrimidine deaminase/5-amino-6-(5-phosphoribosylamino)uracil reductase
MQEGVEKPAGPQGVAGRDGQVAQAGDARATGQAAQAASVCASGPAAPAPDDARFMLRAVELAGRGAGHTNPNPLVGAVIVRDGAVLGEGWHARYGEAHAERNALADCRARGNDPRGATVYVTLEPCCHTGKQPPCADALVEAGVARVVVGSRDPNPLVSGGGVARLRAAGIEVAVDVERAACDALNQVFFHYITNRRPYVVAKWAMTADGRIACTSGDSRWVTGEEARRDAHLLRNRLAAVMVGPGTVRADDPALTCRVEGGRNPLRVVLDRHLSLPEGCTLVRTAAAVPTLVLCAEPAALGPEAVEKAARLRAAGVEVLPAAATAEQLTVAAALGALGARGVDSVLLEGGAALHGAALAEGLVNEVVAYVAPKLVGGATALGPVGDPGAALMADARQLGEPHVSLLGSDVRLVWRAGSTPQERALPCVACGPCAGFSAPAAKGE